METRTLRAHFDGNHILLDEPFELEPNMELLITIELYKKDNKPLPPATTGKDYANKMLAVA